MPFTKKMVLCAYSHALIVRMTSKSHWNRRPVTRFSMVITWDQIGTVRKMMLIAFPTEENLRHSCDDFKTHITYYWFHGMSQNFSRNFFVNFCSRKLFGNQKTNHWSNLHDGPLLKRYHHFETAVVAFGRQLLIQWLNTNTSTLLDMLPRPLPKHKWRRVSYTFMNATFWSDVVHQ